MKTSGPLILAMCLSTLSIGPGMAEEEKAEEKSTFQKYKEKAVEFAEKQGIKSAINKIAKGLGGPKRLGNVVTGALDPTETAPDQGTKAPLDPKVQEAWSDYKKAEKDAEKKQAEANQAQAQANAQSTPAAKPAPAPKKPTQPAGGSQREPRTPNMDRFFKEHDRNRDGRVDFGIEVPDRNRAPGSKDA